MFRNKIVLVPFPFDDLSRAKARLAVCLTEPVGVHQHVVLAFITSRLLPDPMETDIVIESSAQDFGATGLRTSSTLRLHRLMTVSLSLVQRELDELPPRLQEEVTTKLKLLFGLD